MFQESKPHFEFQNLTSPKSIHVLKSLLFLSLIVFSFTASVYGEENKGSETNSAPGKFGIGISLFGPTGLTGKYWIDDKKSFEAGLGFSVFGNGRFHFHGVFLYNFASLSESVGFYGGIGGVVEEKRYREKEKVGRGRFIETEGYETSFGARLPVGLSWRSQDKKFELSGEVYLNVFFLGRGGADLGLVFAGRIYL
ncbi:hypothetical protein [Leptospira yasudae]|uniref:Outer membrane protein beta-barrel domain-containing protein n=1 Tax=Leptospira yasudae TaxID=2202201 RepID=A0ABX9M5N2_9LEPT|nr:hypothetical protein [Leptospira yasudae]RHX80777.1 hypothetical protein DLM77_07805 [Leptospira yasudae]